MKKTWILVFLVGFFAATVHGATITMSQPSGGSLIMGSTYPIAWAANGVTANVRINLIKPGGALVGLIVGNQPPGSSPYSWTVGAPAVAGEQYRVRVAASDGSAMGESAIFTVMDIPQISGLTIQVPDGGESWELGSTKKIQWLATNIQTNCRLVLLKDGAVKGTMRDSFAPGHGENIWNWVVGSYQGGMASAGGGYKVRMELIDGSYRSESVAPFTIVDHVVFVPEPMVFATKVKAEAKLMPFPPPDLVVCLAWSGKMPYIYQDRRVSVRIKNVGPGNAPAGNFKIYVEGHGDQIVQVPVLAAKGEYSWSKKYDWKTCGHKTVRVTVDPGGLITESRENNNMLEGSIKVSCGETGYLLQMDRCSDQN
jgi:hypothetical protein